MKKINKISKIILTACIGILLLTGCSKANKEEESFKNWFTEDFRQVLECENNIYKSYQEALSKLNKYCDSPGEITKEEFLSAVENHNITVDNNLNPSTYIEDDTYWYNENRNSGKAFIFGLSRLFCY